MAFRCCMLSALSSLAHIPRRASPATHNPLRSFRRGLTLGGRNAHTPMGVELQNARITWSRCHGNGIYWKPQAAAAVSIAAKSSLRSLSFQHSSFQSWEGGKWDSISVAFSCEVTIPSAFSEGFSRRQFSENGITCFKECFPISG